MRRTGDSLSGPAAEWRRECGARPGSLPVLRALLLCLGLTGIGYGYWHVKQVAGLNRGMIWCMGYIVPYAQGNDSHPQLIFAGGVPNSNGGVYFYRYFPVNQYRLAKIDTGGHGDTIISPGWMAPWAAGDVFGDSCTELVAANGEMHPTHVFLVACAYGPPSSGLCPDSLITACRYDSQAGTLGPVFLTDLDQDGRKELVVSSVGDSIFIFEDAGGHSLRQVAALVTRGGRIAFGDFDQDGQMEFATAGINWWDYVIIFKCTGDDEYVPWDSIPVRERNGHDAFAGANIDGSHHAVFFVSYWTTAGWTWLYQYEPTQGTQGYQAFPVDSTTFTTGEVNAQSICGDIDGDGIDEILWSTGNQIRAYQRVGPHQYQLVWFWSQSGNNSCNLNLYDMNGNGYNEILESGSGVTHIFEIEAVRVLYPNLRLTFHPGDTCRIRWQTFNPPRCDSVSLFLRKDTTWQLDTIAHGLAPSETACTWVVPDIRSDSCRVVAIAYGPGWQYDESDSCFRIASVGIAEDAAPLVRETRLLGISPNPVRNQAEIRFQLAEPGRVTIRVLDVTGRTIAAPADGIMKSGNYTCTWNTEGTPEGIYFVRLDSPNHRESRKLVLTQ
jgi:hypothetical protein